jgi:hypothetical protein
MPLELAIDSPPQVEACPVEFTEANIRVLQTRAELESIRAIWKEWCTDPRADIDSLCIAADCRPGVVAPYVLAVYCGNRPDCLLVGYLENRCLEQKLGYAVLRHCQVKTLYFTRRGLLGNASDENCRLLVAAISEFLELGGAECAIFGDLRADSPLRASLKREPGILFRQSYFPTQKHNALQFPANFEDYLASLSRKDRHELRRHERMLERDFPNQVRIECVRKEERVGHLLDLAGQIAQKTYQRALGTGFERTAEIEEQYRAAARSGALRGCILYIRERPCAFFLGRQYKSTFFAEYTGYDPEFGKYSPGMFMLLHSIRESFELATGAVQFDLGSGDYAYKRVVCNVGWEEGIAYLYAPNWRGFLLNAQITATSFANAVLRKMAKRNTLLKKARKQWQQRAVRSLGAGGDVQSVPGD